MEKVLLLIPLAPFLGFLVNGLIGRKLPKPLVGFIACFGPVLAFYCAVAIFSEILRTGEPVAHSYYTWIQAGDLTLPFRLLIDRLSIVLVLVVTGVGSLIHIYSTLYMEHEDAWGYARYFAYLNLFMASMLVLITGSSIVMLFIGWEGVGLCSYLLIGFWYTNPDYANAGKKAFVVNRIGDLGFVLGVFTIWYLFHDRPEALELANINKYAQAALDNGELATVAALTPAALLLLLGATGKSAQIPLYVWLPDAMAGPTPVSALIHAATMVTAGVYMTARLHVLFEIAPHALVVVACVGMATAFLAATMAVPENDLKKVLAYSTISQLGYMFVGVGSGAFGAGVFHLMTHAFFKALLFLGAGAVLHAFDNVGDIRQMGGLREKMPRTALIFFVGCLALAGIPPFAGFFSKDEILFGLLNNFLHGHGPVWLILYVAGVITAALTAFYTFRLFTLAFLGSPRGPIERHDHAHDAGPAMMIPLFILAGLSLVGGWVNVPLIPGAQNFSHYLEPIFGAHGPASHAAEAFGLALSTAVAVSCAYAGYSVHLRNPTFSIREGLAGAWYQLAGVKYRVDEAYERVFVQPIMAGAAALWEFVDVGVIDWAVNAAASAASATSERVRRIQVGLVNQYAFYLAGGAVIVVMFVLGLVGE